MQLASKCSSQNTCSGQPAVMGLVQGSQVLLPLPLSSTAIKHLPSSWACWLRLCCRDGSIASSSAKSGSPGKAGIPRSELPCLAKRVLLVVFDADCAWQV